MLDTALEIRQAVPGDIAQIRAIYAQHVLTGLASFEEQPPDDDEMRRRFAEVNDLRLPYLSAEFGGLVAGFGYCAPYRTRSAYRYALEDSIYVRPDAIGRGVGSTLLAALIEIAERLDYRQMVAVIGDSAHAASIALHATHGFVRVGTLRSVGYKFGRWVDSVIMQRPLGTGDGTSPDNGRRGST